MSLHAIAADAPRTDSGRSANIFVAATMAFLIGLALLVWTQTAEAKSAPDSFADLAAKLLPSVVNISTTQVIEGREAPDMPQFPPGSPFEDFFKEFFDRNQQQQQQHPKRPRRATSLGSGFIISDDGFVVTNNHVIQDADEITVILHDDTRLSAKLIGRDAKTDLAVLKVESKKIKLHGVNFGDSGKSRVGDWVVAIGNPFGLGGTVTAGIISARGRDINSGPYDDFIQTDASINRGNSGGPMFNLDGEVIGINTAIFSPSGGSVGIGFAIPSSTAKPVIAQLMKTGSVKRGWLGVHIQAVTEEIAETLGLKEAEGALVASVIEKSPAEAAGIKAGDVILSFDGKKVGEMRTLPKIVAETTINEKVKVELWRDNDDKTLMVAVGELDEDAQVASRTAKPGKASAGQSVETVGLTLLSLTDKVREKFKLAKDAKGVVVSKVAEDGPSAEKGIRPGDLIVEISQQEVTDPKQVKSKVDEARKAGRKSILILVEGQGGLRFVAIRLEKK